MSYNSETRLYEGYIYKIYNDINDKVYIGQTITTIKERWHGHMSATLPSCNSSSYIHRAMRKYGRDNFHIQELQKIEEDSREKLIQHLNILEQYYIKEYKSLSTENGYNFEKGGNNKIVPGKEVCKYDYNLTLLETYNSVEEAGRKNNIDGATIWNACKRSHYTAGGYIWAFSGEQPLMPPYCNNLDRKTVNAINNNTLDVKYQRRLLQAGWNGQRIIQYNAFGEQIAIYEDILVASQKLNTTLYELRKNLEGVNLRFGKTVLRYENEPFDKYPRSHGLQSVAIYDLQGKFIQRFETKKMPKNFLVYQAEK